MDKINRKILSLVTIIILLIVALLSIKELNKKPYDIWNTYFIKYMKVKTISKKHNECGVREVVTGNRRMTSSYQDVYNIYLFIYDNGEVEEVPYVKYCTKKEKDTVMEYGIRTASEIDFNNSKFYKIKDVMMFYTLKTPTTYRVTFENNKVIDTLEIPYLK